MLITNFAAGELSPTLNGRVDLQQYYQGASHLENFEVIPTGGIKRRKGMKRVEELPYNSRVIPFIIDGNNIYILALYAYDDAGTAKGKMAVYKLESTINGPDTTFKRTINTSYKSLEEIREVQYAQTYDRIIMVHRNYPPVEIRVIDEVVEMSEMTFDFNPDVTIADSYNQVQILSPTATGDEWNNNLPIKIQSEPLAFKWWEGTELKTKYYIPYADGYCLKNGKMYKYKYGGWHWEEWNNIENPEPGLFSTTHNYPGAVSFFNNRLFLASTINKQQKIWASMAPSTGDIRYNKFCTYKNYVTVGKVVKAADLHTFTCDIDLDDVTSTSIKLTNISSLQVSAYDYISKSYYVSWDLFPDGAKVIASDTTNNTLTVEADGSKVTTDMTNVICNLSRWRNPNNLTADDYEYQLTQQEVVTADCSFNFELASEQNDAIKFLSNNKILAIATESSIWSLAAGCTALELQVEMQGRYGSDILQGQAIAQATIYFAQGNKGIREFYYDNSKEAFTTNNIAIHAQHLLSESKVWDFDYLTNPYNRLVCTREDGIAVSLLYDKNNAVMAWNRITRDNLIKSAAVTRGFDDTDLIFFVIEDTSTNKFYLELLDDNSEVFLDSWKVYTGSTAGYTNDAILWNKTKNKTCSKSNIPADFSTTGDVVYIGYKYTSYIKSMPCIANDPNGHKRITSLIVRFVDSFMPTLKVTGVADEHFINVTPPFSGVKNITYPGQTDRDVYFELEADDVNPVNILAVNALLA